MTKVSPSVSEARRKAGAASGAARRAKSAATRSPKGMPVALDEEAEKQMKAWTKKIGAPKSWNEARLYVQVEGGVYSNLKTALEVRALRRRLVDSSEVDAVAQKTAALLTGHMKRLGKTVSEQCKDMPIRQRAEVAKLVDQAVREAVEKAQAEALKS